MTLQDSATDLDAVVVVGYGVQRKRDVTGSIASIKGSELATTVAAANPLQGLQGKVAGVEVVQNSARAARRKSACAASVRSPTPIRATSWTV